MKHEDLPKIGTKMRKCIRCVNIYTTIRAQKSPIKLDRSKWEGCYTCNNIPGIMLGKITLCIRNRIITTKEHEFKFCPECGRPLTEEAWAELERRIGGL